MQTTMGVQQQTRGARLGPLLKKAPLIVRLEALCVAAALVAAAGIAGLYGQTGYERTAFAVPAGLHKRDVWATEVDAFADEMHRVFGVRESVADEFSGWILEASTRHDLAPELVASVVFTESSFRKHVKSHAGAMGPAQVRPYWEAFCGADLGDPAENIYCGAQILSHYKNVCGDQQCALLAYNVGINQDDERMFQAGQRYVRKIDKHLADFDSTVL